MGKLHQNRDFLLRVARLTLATAWSWSSLHLGEFSTGHADTVGDDRHFLLQTSLLKVCEKCLVLDLLPFHGSDVILWGQLATGTCVLNRGLF